MNTNELTARNQDELNLMDVFDDERGVVQPIPASISECTFSWAIASGFIQESATPGGFSGRFAQATEAGILWSWNNR